MEHSQEWIVCTTKCYICTHQWVAVAEVERRGEEVDLPEIIECPHCGYMNSDYKILHPDDDEQ